MYRPEEKELWTQQRPFYVRFISRSFDITLPIHRSTMLDNVTVIDETTENRADFFPLTQKGTGFARSTMSHDSALNGNPSSRV